MAFPADFYKIIPCKNFSLLGKCPSGNSCNYAHGDEEAKMMQDKFKQQVEDRVKADIESRLRQEYEQKLAEVKKQLDILKAENEKLTIKSEQMVSDNYTTIKMEIIPENDEQRKLILKTAPIILSAFDNIVQANNESEKEDKVNLTKLQKLVYDCHQHNNWKKIAVELQRMIKKLLRNFLGTRCGDIAKLIELFKNETKEYVKIAKSNDFYSFIDVTIDLVVTRRDTEDLMVYFRRSLTTIKTARKILTVNIASRKSEIKSIKIPKNILCRNFIRYGKCPGGDDCKFSHSEREIQEYQESEARINQGRQSEVKINQVLSMIEEDALEGK